MRTIRTARATLGRRRATTASLAWRVVAVLQAHANESVPRENAQGHTSVIEILASFSSRFAWLFPFIGFWGGERKRPPRPIT
jgi:hypothetical protein